jgi:hypothetical protein
MFELSAYSVQMARDLRKSDIDAAEARAVQRRVEGASAGRHPSVAIAHRVAALARMTAARVLTKPTTGELH